MKTKRAEATWTWILIVVLTIASGITSTAFAVSLFENDKITAGDAAAGDNFGHSVAVRGTMVVVGAPFDNNTFSASGSAYVFDCSSFPCLQVSKLTASDGSTGDFLGWSVAVSGTTVVVGAFGDDSSSGSAYVFNCSSLPCSQVSKLTASDSTSGVQFGTSVAMSGTTIVVGAPSNPFSSDPGAAYYFDLASCGAACTETGKLTASDWAAGDQFGFSVGVSGPTAVIGAPTDDDSGDASGGAYYFDLSSCGAACTETGKLTASDATLFFGHSVAVSGTRAVIGLFSGAAYYFDVASCGAACSETGKLTASDAAAADFFGFSVAVNGTTAIVGAFGDDDGGSASGSAYLFDLSSCGAACNETDKLIASDAAADDRFGHNVALSATTAVAGAPRDDFGSGSAYVFSLAPSGDNQDPDCSGATIADQIAGPSCSASISGDDVTGVTDPDGDGLTITVDPINLSPGANTVTVSADDGNGGSCSIQINVNLLDQTAPNLMVYQPAPASADASCQAEIPVVEAMADDNCDASPALAQDPAAGALVGLGSHTIDVMATDSSGNGTSLATTFDVVDDTAPAISCPADVSVLWTADTSPAATGSATALDNCSVGSVSHSDSVVAGACLSQTITRTWTALDGSGNGSSCDQIIQVRGPSDAIEDLIDVVLSLGLESGIENSLVSKLQNAQTKVEAGATTPADNLLGAFINEVEAQSGNMIASQDASDLIATAQAIIDAANSGGGCV